MNATKRFSTVFFIITLWTVCTGSRLMHDTNGYSNAFDCLHIVTLRTGRYGAINDILSPQAKFEIVRFCRRSVEDLSIPNKTTMNGQQLTFNQLREMNISSDQLLDWFAPMDIVEEYAAGKVTGLFFNCSDLWFGAQCEYTFDSDKILANLIQEQEQQRRKYSTTDILSMTNGTCYVMDYEECNSIICLDWREICDGKIDCSNGLDEYYCLELDRHECDPQTEYRCSNAQCIDKTLYGDYFPDCMDESDENIFNSKLCELLDFLMACENYACSSLLFSCGDGHCYDGPNLQYSDGCITQRDRLYFSRMPPSSLILYSHIYLIYRNTTPDMICFNQTLCPYLVIENKTQNGLTCRPFETFTTKTYVTFDEMLRDVKRFVRSCSLLPLNHEMNQCSLFQCADHSKCLSYHRLLDGTADCANEEDEHYPNTCALELPYRFECDNGTKCLSRSLVFDGVPHCFDKSDEHIRHWHACFDPLTDQCLTYQGKTARFDFTFSEICNGIIERISNISNDTDESHCLKTEWPCSTHYTDCNWIWNCPDGSDELKTCSQSSLSALHCNSTKHFCLNVDTGHPRCLPKTRANDGIVDCVGSIDEPEFCRMKYPGKSIRQFRCNNSDICIHRYQICDCHQDCPDNDDETTACVWLNNGRESFCHPRQFRCRNGRYLATKFCNTIHMCSEGEDNLFCEVDNLEREQMFEISRFPDYSNRALTASTLWQCNSGLYVRSTIDPPGFFCLCSNYYYGDHCQFQRKRVSLILQLRIDNLIDNHMPILKFVVLLVRDHLTLSIISHEEFIYTPQQHCSPRYMLELLYPIDDLPLVFFNHTIHIHAFIANTLRHVAFWNFPIFFEFLPVRRLAKELVVMNISTTLSTTITYSNCTSCSSDSLCLGYGRDLQRDICVCPLDRTGRRCLIVFNPCAKTNCSGHGRCVPLDVRYDVRKQFMCLCDEEWFGEGCEKVKPHISISFVPEISIPLSNIVFIHVIETFLVNEPRVFTYFRRVHREMFNLTFYFDHRRSIANLVFIQLYEHQDRFDFYLLLLRGEYSPSLTELHAVVRPSRRCRPIHELFNQTVLNQPPLRRVKNYQRQCLDQQAICFYDETLMCLCDRTNHVNCFHFHSTPRKCSRNKCHSHGMCVQDDEICPTSAVCVCKQCSYGSTCQFSKADYSLSLDAIIGSHIRSSATNIFQQSAVCRMAVLILGTLILLGLSFNTLAFGTFMRKMTHESGCGLYLLVASILGLLAMVALICKIVIVFNPKQTNIGCSLMEFLLKWSPTSCEWLYACVATDRAYTVIYPIKYSRSASQRFARRSIVCILIFLAIISCPELIFRRIVIDSYDERAWCVLTLNADRQVMLILYSITNVLLFLLPLLINFITSIIIIYKTTTFKNQQYLNNKIVYSTHSHSVRLGMRVETLRKSIDKHKHILIAPVVLGCLGIPRLILSFIFVCKKLDRQPYISLVAYCIAFLPCMAIVFVFILPSNLFRVAMTDFMRSIVSQRIQTLLTAH
ncbi:unnamed protein product [Adineta ricciae]|uniref:Uncharacterized protein n=1 Tax=Adineta ricciae TaxID=249248 RepID=A0A815GSK9_ADIRI|nr:unnamed protein product [Adineta ricciae]